MGVAAIVEDGKITNAKSTTSTKEKSSTLGKDDFLQLLVAQMKFQDPLEPTSNTEYIAQYATFSEVEQIQNMSKSMDLFHFRERRILCYVFRIGSRLKRILKFHLRY